VIDARRSTFFRRSLATSARFLASSAHHSDAACFCSDADQHPWFQIAAQDSAAESGLPVSGVADRALLLNDMKIPQRVTMVEVGRATDCKRGQRPPRSRSV
jgi:hypothetical protein